VPSAAHQQGDVKRTAVLDISRPMAGIAPAVARATTSYPRLRGSVHSFAVLLSAAHLRCDMFVAAGA